MKSLRILILITSLTSCNLKDHLKNIENEQMRLASEPKRTDFPLPEYCHTIEAKNGCSIIVCSNSNGLAMLHNPNCLIH